MLITGDGDSPIRPTQKLMARPAAASIRGLNVDGPAICMLLSIVTRPHQGQAGELRKSPEGRLRGIEAETKVFLAVVVVPVRRLMMVRIGASDNARDPLVLAHADRGHEILEPDRVGAGHVGADRRAIPFGVQPV